MQGRWTLAPVDGDSSRGRRVTATNPDDLYGEAVPVVPCDDAAIERAARSLADDEWDQDDALHGMWRDLAVKALRAAGETP